MEKWEPARCERAEAEAVVAAAKDDDAGLAGVEEGGFEGGFDSVGAGVAENDFGGAALPALEGEGGEFFAKFGFGFGGVDVAHGVNELGGLCRHRRCRRAVSEGGDAKRGGEVEVAVAVGVPDVHAVCALPKNGPLGRGEGDVARLSATQPCGEREGPRAGDGRVEFR